MDGKHPYRRPTKPTDLLLAREPMGYSGRVARAENIALAAFVVAMALIAWATR